MRRTNRHKYQPELAGLEGRLLLSTAAHHLTHPHHRPAAHVHRAHHRGTTATPPIASPPATPPITSLPATPPDASPPATPPIASLPATPPVASPPATPPAPGPIKTILSAETSETAPAVAQFNGRTYLAYVGIGNNQLNVVSTPDGTDFGSQVTLPDSSVSGLVSPAMAVFNGRLYLAWTGGSNDLNIESSTDGIHFGNKITFSETSNVGPSLAAFNGRLYMGWTGRDGHLNVMSTPDGTDFGNKVTLTPVSFQAPSLAAYRGQLWIAYQGADSGHHLDVMTSSDGIHFGSPFQTSQTSPAASALTVVQPATPGQPSCLVLGWMGTNDQLNYMTTTTNAAGFSKAVLLPQFSENGITICSPARGRLALGWTGLDAYHRLNLMEMSV
jgi:hypothetical protein